MTPDPTDPEVITEAELDEWYGHAQRFPQGKDKLGTIWMSIIEALRACRHDFRCVAEQAAEQGRLMIEIERRAKAKDAVVRLAQQWEEVLRDDGKLVIAQGSLWHDQLRSALDREIGGAQED